MAEKQVSIQLARLFVVFKCAGSRWLTNREVAAQAEIAERTARMHTLRLAKLGILEHVNVFPGRYRLVRANHSLVGKVQLQKLETACEILGVNKT